MPMCMLTPRYVAQHQVVAAIGENTRNDLEIYWLQVPVEQLIAFLLHACIGFFGKQTNDCWERSPLIKTAALRKG